MSVFCFKSTLKIEEQRFQSHYSLHANFIILIIQILALKMF